MDTSKRYIEVTAELVMKGAKQVCYLHRSDRPYPERFTQWVPKGGSALKPGFYEVDPHAVWVRTETRPNPKPNGRPFQDEVLALGGLKFVSERNPLEVPAAPVAAAAPSLRRA